MKSRNIKFSVVTAGLVLLIAIPTFPQSPGSPELGWNVVPTTDGGSVLLGPEAGSVRVGTASIIFSPSANTCPGFKVVLQGISYSICIHKSSPPGRVTFVSTADPGFSTPDKVAIGDHIDHLINEPLRCQKKPGFHASSACPLDGLRRFLHLTKTSNGYRANSTWQKGRLSHGFSNGS